MRGVLPFIIWQSHLLCVCWCCIIFAFARNTCIICEPLIGPRWRSADWGGVDGSTSGKTNALMSSVAHRISALEKPQKLCFQQVFCVFFFSPWLDCFSVLGTFHQMPVHSIRCWNWGWGRCHNSGRALNYDSEQGQSLCAYWALSSAYCSSTSNCFLCRADRIELWCGYLWDFVPLFAHKKQRKCGFD